MTVSVPWRTLRSNPRTSREAELQGEEPSPEASAKASSSSEFTFDVGDLTKRLMFGGITGGVTGLAFGLMDGQKAVTGAKYASSSWAVKTREGMRLTALSGSLFGAYFAFYQGCKYAAKLARGQDDFINVCFAAPLSLTPMIPLKTTRQRFPYAVLLIAIDTLNNHVLQ